MKQVLAALMASLALSAQVRADGLDCAALANSTGVEPPGYAAQCLGESPAWSPPLLLSAGAASSQPAPDTAYVAQVRPSDDHAPQGLYRFTLPDFPAYTRVGTASDTPNMWGLDFNPAATRLYGMQFLLGGGGTRIGTFNLTTGAFRPVALALGLNLRDQMTGLTIDPRRGTAYFSTNDTLTNNPQLSEARLYTADLGSGFVTLVGRILPDELNPVIIDLAMNCSGELYAHNITDDSIYRLNPATGAATRVGSHGLAANFAQGMDFDNADGQLYAWIYTGNGRNTFGTLDTATGALAPIVSDNPLGQWEGAIGNQCPETAIDVDALTGGWFAPYSNGQGFTARWFPQEKVLFMPWFTYSVEGGQERDELRWFALFADVDPEAGPVESIEFSILQVLGGNFDAPPAVSGTVVGQATLRMFSCYEGVLDYQFDPGVNDGATGSITMSRLLDLTSDCTEFDGAELPANARFDPLYSGSWFDPETAGQGLELFRFRGGGTGGSDLGNFYGAWFTFAPEPEEPGPPAPAGQRWFTLQGVFGVTDTSFKSNIILNVGGSFDNEPSLPGARQGEVVLESVACDRLKLTYTFDDNEDIGEFRDLEGEILLHRLGACPEDPED
ncbi:MAG: hypothetical protein U0S76_04535 [Pseudoxanthomonas sp.]|nr:hypothetical protein [Pseudoxanthomonas sp.]